MATAAAEAMVESRLVGDAIDSLSRWDASRDNGRIRLLDSDKLVYLSVALRKIPAQGRSNPVRIVLPHPVLDASSNEICLIVDDKRRDEAKQRVLAEGIRVSKVLGLTKLKNNFKTFEARRKLCGSYDLFLAEKSVASKLPTLLGKVFYKKKKHPILIDLRKSQWRAQFDWIMNSTFLFTSTGNNCSVKVGRLEQPRDEIVKNVMAVIDAVAGAHKWNNILALHLKSLESPGLPVYQAPPTIGVKITKSKPQQVQVVKLSSAQEPAAAAAKPAEPAAAAAKPAEPAAAAAEVHHAEDSDSDNDEQQQQKSSEEEEEEKRKSLKQLKTKKTPTKTPTKSKTPTKLNLKPRSLKRSSRKV